MVVARKDLREKIGEILDLLMTPTKKSVFKLSDKKLKKAA